MSPNTLSRTVRIRRRISVAAVAATCLTAMIGSPATTATAAAVEPSFAAVSAAASLTGTQLRAEIARVARTQVGYTGSSQLCQKYGGACADWCAMFATWTWETAGVAGVPRREYVARGLGKWGVDHGLFKRRGSGRGPAAVGDWVIYGPPDGQVGGHVSVVTALHDDGTITTVDGNYDNKVVERRINPATATARGGTVTISGYVSPPGAAASRGSDTVGWYRGSDASFHLANAHNNLSSAAFVFGPVNMTPIAGDWNGDGVDTVGWYRGSDASFHLTNSTLGGASSAHAFVYGPAGMTPIAGDWNGDGTTTVGWYRGSDASFHLTNTHSGAASAYTFVNGPANTTPITGNWNGA